MKTRKVFLAAIILLFAAVLVSVICFCYITLAPKTYSASTKVLIAQTNTQTPVMIQQLPLNSFRNARDLILRQARGSSIIEVVALAPSPAQATALVNEHLTDLRAVVKGKWNTELVIVQPVTPNLQHVRPATKRIMVSAGISSANFALIGVACLVVHGLRKRSVLEQPADFVAKR